MDATTEEREGFTAYGFRSVEDVRAGDFVDPGWLQGGEPWMRVCEVTHNVRTRDGAYQAVSFVDSWGDETCVLVRSFRPVTTYYANRSRRPVVTMTNGRPNLPVAGR